MTFIKLNQADLDSPRRELSNGGLKIVVTLLVRWQINFLSAQTLTLNPAVRVTLLFCYLLLFDISGIFWEVRASCELDLLKMISFLSKYLFPYYFRVK